MLKVRIKKLDENAKLPTRGSSSAAGFDLYALNSEAIRGGTTKLIHTGIAIEIPEGYFGAIYARSGLATKKGLRPANCVGIIDSDYRGEVMVALHCDNSSTKWIHQAQAGPEDEKPVVHSECTYDKDSCQHVEAGERIAQLIIQKYEAIEFAEVDELSDTQRGDKGFGSSGSK